MTSVPDYSSASLHTIDKQGRPSTIPALQEWTASSGVYTFSEHTHIVLDQASFLELQSTGTVFAEDILQQTGFSIPLISAASAGNGDIFLSLISDDTSLGVEGYRLEIGSAISISAATVDGVFYGTRTLLQLLRQQQTLPAGTARDWPDYPQRSLMVDVGRKYFSIPWLENHIRELAYLKYNYLHLHLSDNYGFRLPSERHPEVVSKQYYTKAELQALIELAQRYHITIVPEIDMPGHMDPILAQHPELQLISTSGKRKPGDIDLGNEASYVLLKDLLDEFIPLFPGPYWHIGADEYLMTEAYTDYPQLLKYAHDHYGPDATERDTYLGFVNWAHEIVKAHGKRTRTWNDGLYGGTAITAAADMIYEHWDDSGLTPAEIVERGISIMNCNGDYLYYVLAPAVDENGNGPHFNPSPAKIYEIYEQHIFQNQHTIAPHHPLNVGAKLHVWCDYPNEQTEQQIDAGIELLLRSLAQKNWGSAKLVPAYDQYQAIISRIGRAPGYITLPLAE
ncbi:beta-N-acetylhexosaminidase [Dictyobacter arantiisoli]|uniref:Uncharacterized protein n=1 Tax=Dictyobacter arantiisoli TaxID=2014874 RepID=A0A5A5T7K9_9CHLR|nr:glycoside hydrolase family 20 protein [Dictyobacter arantiisoli]GCF06993.1 hypothetical protein KDI_05570 [Dictyobacter arantiisoli]